MKPIHSSKSLDLNLKTKKRRHRGVSILKEVAIPGGRMAVPMVIWVPIRCPSCSSTEKRQGKGRRDYEKTVRYHKCLECGTHFASMEASTVKEGARGG